MTAHKTRRLILALFTLALPLFPEEPGNAESARQADAESDRVTAISVSGLKRTKRYVVETPLQKFMGRRETEINRNDVYAIVKETGVLEPESVEIVDNEDSGGKVLKITVREKWAFVPIPFFSADSSGWSLGGAITDANAFGIKDSIVVMGNYDSGSWMAGLMYFHSAKAVGSLGWQVIAVFASREEEAVDQTGEETLRRFSMTALSPSFGLSYPLSESFTASVNVSYRNMMMRESEDALHAPENGVQAITLNPGISVRRSSWDGYFLSENSVSLKYEYTAILGGDDVQAASFSAAVNHSLVPGLRLISRSGVAAAVPSASPLFESSPSSAGVNILPMKFSARNFAGVSLGLEQYLHKFPFGTLSLTAVYQAVYSHSDLLPHQFDHGAAAMLRLYLSRLALPGMGFGVSYNVDKDVFQYAFNVGMSL
ncbi:MAG: BamA/TamA family outer membrane protein [Treponematales bacterium]